MINLIIAEDNDIIRNGLLTALGNEPDMTVITASANGREALEAIMNGKQPDILLTDYNMPELNGLELSSYISQNFKEIRVVMLSITDVQLYGARLQNAGIHGFVGKEEDVTILTTVIREVYEGKTRLPHD
jgi:DNA-binding NarL/FixJ family response regulator